MARDDDDDDSDLDREERRRRNRAEADADVREAKRRRKESRRGARYRRRPRPKPAREKVPVEVIIMDRVIPLALIVVGLAVSFLAAGGIGGKDGAWRALAYMGAGLAGVIPVTIGALVLAGILLGIDYGELKGAILKLAAIATVNNAILWTGEWVGWPFWSIPVAGIACFALFLLLFGIDAWEGGMSLVIVGLIQFFAKLLLLYMMISQDRYEERKKKRESAAAPMQIAACGLSPPCDNI